MSCCWRRPRLKTWRRMRSRTCPRPWGRASPGPSARRAGGRDSGQESAVCQEHCVIISSSDVFRSFFNSRRREDTLKPSEAAADEAAEAAEEAREPSSTARPRSRLFRPRTTSARPAAAAESEDDDDLDGFSVSVSKSASVSTSVSTSVARRVQPISRIFNRRKEAQQEAKPETAEETVAEEEANVQEEKPRKVEPRLTQRKRFRLIKTPSRNRGSLVEKLLQNIDKQNEVETSGAGTGGRRIVLETKVIRMFPNISQSRRRPLLGPSPG